MSYSDAVIDVVGVGADGVDGLPGSVRQLVLEADLIVGAQRLLDSVSSDRAGTSSGASGGVQQEWRALPSPLLPALPALLAECRGRRVVVLASGDPLVSGIASTLLRALDVEQTYESTGEQVRVHPGVSSVALARARMTWPAEGHATISLVSTPVEALHRWLTPSGRLIVLSAGSHTPGAIARLLVDAGWPDAQLTVLGYLGSADETRLDVSASALAVQAVQVPALNIVAIDLGQPEFCSETSIFGMGWTPGLPDEAFAHDGQLTKWELRIAALARLRPAPGHLLWDLGAGCGSISIEWARSHPTCRALAVERDETRAALIERNAAALGVPRSVQVQLGRSDDLLSALPDPDAVFIGGGATTALIDSIWARLRPGGRLVAHAVTLQTESVLLAGQQRLGGHLRRLAVDRAEPLGSLTSWTPARPVVQWAAAKMTQEDS